MNPQNCKTPKKELIEVRPDELLFIRKNAPTAFARIVSESLMTDGHRIDRFKVHNELTTLKDNYDSVIINKARELLKVLSNVEYQPNESAIDTVK